MALGLCAHLALEQVAGYGAFGVPLGYHDTEPPVHGRSIVIHRSRHLWCKRCGYPLHKVSLGQTTPRDGICREVMHHEMGSLGQHGRRQRGGKIGAAQTAPLCLGAVLGSQSPPLALGTPQGSAQEVAIVGSGSTSDSQAFAAFGAARGDDRTTTAGLHAHQKTMSARATGFRSLVSAFHGWQWRSVRARIRETRDYSKKALFGQRVALQRLDHRGV